MQIVVYILSAVLGFFGLMFLVGAQGQVMRMVLGAVLLSAAGVLVYLFRMKPEQRTLIQKIDLSGDVHLEKLKCKACGGALSKKSVAVQAGAVFVNCEYCSHSYQLEEEPKW